MGRVLSIDYGKKRTGLAVTDSLKISANPLDTVQTSTLLTYLANYIQRENVERVVIGAPKQVDNSDSENMPRVKQFVTKFKEAFPAIPIDMFDERFTSKLAHQTILDCGIKKRARQDKALVDKVSAVIILQGYLESLQYKTKI